MKSSRSTKRRWLVSLVLMLTFISSLSAQAVGLAAKSPPAFRDGEWIANFSMHTTASSQLMKITTSYQGKMGLVSAGGELSGEWTLVGSSSYTGDISGNALLDGNGKVSGTSTEPIISTNKLVADMDVTVGGVAAHQSMDFGSGGNMPLTLTSSTCNQVIADIEAPVNDSYKQAGMTSYASGSFVATRVDDLYEGNSVDYQGEVGDLLEETETLKQKAVEEGSIPFAKLNELVSKAENLQTAIRKNTECGEVSDKQFMTVITGTMIDLAYFALSKPELFTTGELNRLVMAALSVGAMGSGATDPQTSSDLSAKFSKEFSDRLGDAEANKNCMEATQIKLAGLALNNPALTQQANDLITAIC